MRTFRNSYCIGRKIRDTFRGLYMVLLHLYEELLIDMTRASSEFILIRPQQLNRFQNLW
jgi:hypothetical protein